MDWLRLKNPTLCQLVLYAPAMTFFAVILLGFPMLGLCEDLSWLWLLLFIGSAVFSISYLFRHMILFIGTDILFSTIRCWKRDRLWYLTPECFHSRSAAEAKVLERFRGKVLVPVEQMLQPVLLGQQKEISWTIHYRGIEKNTMVYSVSELHQKMFEQIMASARANLQKIRIPESAFVSTDSRQKNKPAATATAVVILADRIDAEVTEIIRRTVSGVRGCMLPCAVDCSDGRCWFDAMGGAYMIGMAPKPEKNYAQDIIRHLLFSGYLPLNGSGPMLPFPIKSCSPDMTLRELLKQYSDAVGMDFLVFLKLGEKWITRKMKNGDTMLHKGKLYCKVHKKVAELMTETDQNDPRNIRITLPEYWCLPKQNKTSKEDRQRIQKQAVDWLEKQGYRVFIAEDR